MPDEDPFKTRLRAELTELEDRFAKLDEFIGTEGWRKLDIAERARLREQHRHMGAYKDVLAARARALGIDPRP
jgi:hypothetical protein